MSDQKWWAIINFLCFLSAAEALIMEKEVHYEQLQNRNCHRVSDRSSFPTRFLPLTVSVIVRVRGKLVRVRGKLVRLELELTC